MKSYLSALRNIQISLGLPDPHEQSSLPRLKRVLAGIQRCRLQQGGTPRIRLPITAQTLSRMKDILLPSANQDKLVIWAIACSAFFGFFRLGELLPSSMAEFNPATSLSWGDVAVDNHDYPRMVQFHLKRSKCDQFGAGSDVVVGVTGSPLCPVSAILAYITTRGSAPGPFFLDSRGKAALKPGFVAQIRSILSAIGIPSHQYAGHSFRIGAATTASLAGIQDSTIQALGRWSSTAFLQYIRMPKDRLASISGSIARQHCPPLHTPS